MQLAIAPRLDLAIKCEHLPRLEAVFHIRGVEPDAFQAGSPLAGGHFENRHAAGTEQRGRSHLRNHRRHLARPQFRDAARIQAIFVAEGKVMQQIIDRADILRRQYLGQFGANSFQILHWGAKFKHLQRW